MRNKAETAKLALEILTTIRDSLDSVNLDMSDYFNNASKKICQKNRSISHIRNQQQYKDILTDYEDNECKTSCCLAGMIPMVNWKWAKEHRMDFADMSGALTAALHDLELGETGKNKLWQWLFASNWNNNKLWAIERLNLVIEEKMYYVLEYWANSYGYTETSTNSLKDVNSMNDLMRITKIKGTPELAIINLHTGIKEPKNG